MSNQFVYKSNKTDSVEITEIKRKLCIVRPDMLLHVWFFRF